MIARSVSMRLLENRFSREPSKSKICPLLERIRIAE